jgi:carbon storage regulator CsrA
MLVLTRKMNEQILIGENIKITLVRVRGNSVRIGIEAPREVRVVRGELDAIDSNSGGDAAFELGDREEVFAHPQPALIGRHKRKPARGLLPSDENNSGRTPQAVKPQVFVGRVRCVDDPAKLSRAPLADFVAAS